ncbi:hypothetical protein, partial [Escherichia coli]|uniref:hypothetical protein n=1 Tax=Escherichia coli TaxID=562 RepID=UPI003F5146CB
MRFSTAGVPAGSPSRRSAVAYYREGDVPAGPLDKTFAPLLRLLGEKSGGGGGDTHLNLQPDLTRVTR